MEITCISDLHGAHPQLEGGDLLIVAGDLTASDEQGQHREFGDWLKEQKYRKKILVGGNHDNRLYKITAPGKTLFFPHTGCNYLYDSGTEFEGLKIWGSPWSLRFDGINPHCKAFTGTEDHLAKQYAKIPDDTNILVTHGPPHGIFDTVRRYGPFSHEREENVGSMSLLMKATSLPNLKLFVFGHIHEGYGMCTPDELINFANQQIARPAKCKSFPYVVNASHMNADYEPVNKPIRVIL